MASTLIERRKAAGLSQQKLAELAGCSIQMVRVLEGGLRPTRSRVLERIETVLADHDADGGVPSDAPTDRIGKQAA